MGGEVHFLFPFPFPQQWGGDPEAFTVGFSTRLRPGTTSSFLSVRGVERAGPARKTPGLKAGELRTGAWRARRPGEAAALNCEAGEGFPQDCLGSERRDPARTGSLREENGTRRPRFLSCRAGTSDFSRRVDPLPKYPKPQPTHALGDRATAAAGRPAE